jgi:hypothetical protein
MAMKTLFLIILITWPLHDNPEPYCNDNEPILIAKTCPEGYNCAKLKWGYWRLREKNHDDY